MVPALGADAKSANGVIEIRDAWARASKSHDTTAYLDILNHGMTADMLVAGRVHRSLKGALQRPTGAG